MLQGECNNLTINKEPYREMDKERLLHCEERKRLGEERRRTLGRSKHATWNPKRRTYDVVNLADRRES